MKTHSRYRHWLVTLVLVAALLPACSAGSDDPEPAATAPAAIAQPSPTAPASATPSATTSASLAPSPASTITPSKAPATAPVATSTLQAASTPVDGTLEGVALADALRGGGYVIYFRHAATDHAQTDTNRGDLSDCATQRNLNDAGRAQARAIGVAFQGLAIPVGALTSSEYCRARETAELAFGAVETTPDLSALPGLDEAERERRLAALRDMLATLPDPGANTVLVAHQFNLRDAVQVDLGTEGEAAIFRPDGSGFALVARVLPEEWAALSTQVNGPRFQEYDVPAGSRPHDVSPAVDGGIWYTAQGSGELGWLDPVDGEIREIALGAGSAPHGVITGPDGAPWITDGGLNAIVRVDPATSEVQVHPLPDDRAGANLNTAVFDASGILWFTGQNGIYGRLDPASGEMQVFDAPRGRGPYGITATADGAVYYASLAGSYVGRIDPLTGAATELDPPTAGQGARRVWADSTGRVWVSEWNAGQVGVYDPASAAWREWPLPATSAAAQAYAVYVDGRDVVWLSDFPNNALVRFDPAAEAFEPFPLPSNPANVRQIHGRPGEVWGAESAADKLVVLRVP
jgi:virginiamycin B lyase